MLRKYTKKVDFNSTDYDKLSISDLKKMADYWLRQYLLNQEESDYIFCPLKKRKFHSSEMQVAHFIDRSCMNTRYDLDNCHLVSTQSNSWDAQVQVEGFKSLHHKDYEEFLEPEKVEKLKLMSEEIRLFQKEDYIEVIEKFRNG